MLSKLLAIAVNTFIETIRQPIYSVLLWAGAGLMALSPALAAFTLEAGNDIKVMKDVGLATLLLYGLLAGIFSATTVITREIESFTVLTVVSKPVSRPLFFFGKYLGVVAALLLGFFFLCLVLFMTARHGTMETVTDKYDGPVWVFGLTALGVSLIVAAFGNYVYGWHFTSTLVLWVVPLGALALALVLFISPKWQFQPPDTNFGDLQLPYAVLGVFFAVMILAAFAVALATRFSQVVTLVFCVGIFFLGLLSDYWFGRAAQSADNWLYALVATVLPNFQFFWFGDAITQELMIPGAQLARVAGYTLVYTLAVLSLGVALFQTREVG